MTVCYVNTGLGGVLVICEMYADTMRQVLYNS